MEREPLLRVRGLGKTIPRRTWWGAERPGPEVLRNVSLDLDKGRTLGLVGPSGSGKSTLARCLALFEPPSAGEISIDGRNPWTLPRRARAPLRARVQLIFQEPAASLNPRFTAAEIVSEPLLIQKRGGRREARARVLMEIVGLPPASAGKRALEFSGGERQRLAIARALALEPELLILDESLSGLDLSVRAQISNLLVDLQETRGLAYVLISHDLSIIAHLADEIAVMDGGEIVERAPAAELCAHPRHARTRELLAAAAVLAPDGAPL